MVGIGCDSKLSTLRAHPSEHRAMLLDTHSIMGCTWIEVVSLSICLRSTHNLFYILRFSLDLCEFDSSFLKVEI